LVITLVITREAYPVLTQVPEACYSSEGAWSASAGSDPGNGPADKAGTAPRIDFTTHVSAAMTELLAARDWLTVYPYH